MAEDDRPLCEDFFFDSALRRGPYFAWERFFSQQAARRTVRKMRSSICSQALIRRARTASACMKNWRERFARCWIDQHLVSLDTLFALSDGLNEMEQGRPRDEKMLGLAGELREFEMPRPIFTKSEKIDWAPRIYSTHHAELQVQTDLSKVIKTPGSRAQLEVARGQLAPFLRDTLVGLNYAYYEPPGAQILHNNPLFIRAHDFSGISMIGSERLWQAPVLLGVGTPAGGGAYLMGSLADLPYALAMAEQDFIAPENIQALIWKELVPDLLVSATLPRWWAVSPNELHAAALYQRSGEELLIASVKRCTAAGQGDRNSFGSHVTAAAGTDGTCLAAWGRSGCDTPSNDAVRDFLSGR